MPSAEEQPDAYGSDGFDELTRLNARLEDLVQAHQSAADPMAQAELAAQLRTVRERIANLTRDEQPSSWSGSNDGSQDPYGLAPPVPYGESDPFHEPGSFFPDQSPQQGLDGRGQAPPAHGQSPVGYDAPDIGYPKPGYAEPGTVGPEAAAQAVNGSRFDESAGAEDRLSPGPPPSDFDDTAGVADPTRTGEHARMVQGRSVPSPFDVGGFADDGPDDNFEAMFGADAAGATAANAGPGDGFVEGDERAGYPRPDRVPGGLSGSRLAASGGGADPSDGNPMARTTGDVGGRRPRPESGSSPGRRVEPSGSGGGRSRRGTSGRRRDINSLDDDSFSLGSFPKPLIAAVAISLALLAVVGINELRGSDETLESADADTVAPASPDEIDGMAADIRAVLSGMGMTEVSVEPGENAILLSGSVPDAAARDSVVGAATALAGRIPVDAGDLNAPAGDDGGQAVESTEATAASPGSDTNAEAMQRELNRILASTPIIFDTGQTNLTERHQRILNNIVATIVAYPGMGLSIVGYTDGAGTDAANQQLSQARAQGVKDYLVGQGVPDGSLRVEAMGEQSSTGSDALALLERRVEFKVEGTGGAPAGTEATTLKVAVVAPSARNDLAFTQSMVDAVNTLGQERPLEVSITDNTFVPEEAADAIRSYADQGYDLIIAHGSQFGASLVDIAPEYPDVVFAWGTASDTFDLPNVYAYDAKSEEGGYVLGAISGRLTSSGVVGVVGPLEVGDAARYVNGFQAGAKAERNGIDIPVTYTESFSDLGLAAEAAEEHVAAGADIMTGSAQMVVGAVDVAAERGVLWFGTQSNQTSLAPGIVVASQVYKWEVVLRSIAADIDNGAPAGRTYSIDLANGGIVIEYNPDFALADEIRQRADQVSAEIANGTIVPAK